MTIVNYDTPSFWYISETISIHVNTAYITYILTITNKNVS